MKKLVDYVKKTKKKDKKVSLKEMDKEVQEKLESIDGTIINECCNTCCADKCCNPVCGPEYDQLVYFYSEKEITEMLNKCVTVQKIFNLHKQFGNQFRYTGETPDTLSCALYFKEKIDYVNTDMLARITANQKNAQRNLKVHEFVKSLAIDNNFTYPVILTRLDNTAQIFFIKGTGTNGKEGSIKNSLLEIYTLLSKLEEEDGVKGANVLDIAIDNADDVYTFVISVAIDLNDFETGTEIPVELVKDTKK